MLCASPAGEEASVPRFASSSLRLMSARLATGRTTLTSRSCRCRSIHLLTSAAAVARHLRVAAELLQVGGLHVIEATHPADLSPGGVSHTEWTEVRGDTIVDARFRMHINRVTEDQVVPVTLEVVRNTVRRGSAAGAGGRNTVPSTATPRLRQEDRWFIPDLDRWHTIIGMVANLRLVAALGDFNVNVPFEHAAAWRLILVLKRTA